MSQVAHTPPEEIVGREAEEWIGATPDTPVPGRVKLRVFRRWNGVCHISGRKIRKFALDLGAAAGSAQSSSPDAPDGAASRHTLSAPAGPTAYPAFAHDHEI